jgi:ATP-dependent protease ClpP protease subunit
MKRIELRGVIVPSGYDVEWMQQYIDKGIITPESKFRAQLAGAAGDDIEIYINSPGGSVFAGNECINAIQQHKAQHQKAVHVTIGAMAASMAAVLAVNVADKLSMFRNSKLMFHGAWTETVGGEEAHKDTADLLEKMNADIKAVLLGRYNIAPELVDEWFAEGRAGWVTAEQAKEFGMVQEIIDQDDEPCKKMPKSASNMLMQNGLKIAACLEGEVVEPGDLKPDEPGPDAKSQSTTPTPQDPAAVAKAEDSLPEAAVAGVTSAEPAAAAAEPAVDPVALLEQVKHLEASNAALTEQLASTAKTLTEAQAVAAGFQSRYDKAAAAHQAELKAAQDALAMEKELNEVQAKKLTDAEGRLAKLTSSAFGGAPEVEVSSWAAAMASCGGDYVKARNQYPHIFSAYLKSEKVRTGGK